MRAYEKIAAHLGEDRDTVKTYRYQPTRWTRPVFNVWDGYWCAGLVPAKPMNGENLNWQKVISSYDRKTVLWFAECN